MSIAKHLTAKHRQLASRMDVRMKQLQALGLPEMEIISGMADFMQDFHYLIKNLTSHAMDVLCNEFGGFYDFAKIIETIALGLSSGRITVPSGNASYDEKRIASAIHQHVLQLESKGCA